MKVTCESKAACDKDNKDIPPSVIDCASRSCCSQSFTEGSIDITNLKISPAKIEQKDESNPFVPNFRLRELHDTSIRKDVPTFALYCLRGVRCKLCWRQFKGRTCVQDLIGHTKQKHFDKATPSFMKRLKEETTFEKILGNGIRYCTCHVCIHAGVSRWDKRFDRARRISNKNSFQKHLHM